MFQSKNYMFQAKNYMFQASLWCIGCWCVKGIQQPHQAFSHQLPLISPAWCEFPWVIANNAPLSSHCLLCADAVNSDQFSIMCSKWLVSKKSSVANRMGLFVVDLLIVNLEKHGRAQTCQSDFFLWIVTSNNVAWEEEICFRCIIRFFRITSSDSGASPADMLFCYLSFDIAVYWIGLNWTELTEWERERERKRERE